MATIEEITTLLHHVKDPEIPVLSLVDLGVISGLEIQGDNIHVELTPTFSGCPAMDRMKEDVEGVLKAAGFSPTVNINFLKPWSTDKISPEGLKALKAFGLALPGTQGHHIEDIELMEQVQCPFCDSHNTRLDSLFGATLCRAIHYCHSCNQSFEQFKPL